MSEDSSTGAPSISLILPAYNEAETIRAAIREADDALTASGSEYELLVVDDGSRDRTAELARLEAQTRPRVRVISYPQNRGYGAALRTGFAAAKMDLVGYSDSDCQFDVSEIENLVLICKRHDVACGYRLARKDPWLRRLLARAYNVMVGALFGLGVRDCDCAMKLVRRSVLEAVACETNGFFIDTELLARLRRSGASIVEVGVTHRARLAGASTVTLRQVRLALAELVRFWWGWTLFPSRFDRASTPRWPSRWVAAALVALLAVAGVLLLSGQSHSLMKPDEIRYARISGEMLAAHDYVTPTLGGQPYLDKPPLLYWLVSASYSLFGENVRAARLPGALATLLSVLLTFVLGRLLVGDRAGLLGALLLLTTLGLCGAGHYVATDSILIACTTAGLLALFVAMESDEVRRGWSVVAGIACALGFLAKGPVALVLVLPPVLVGSWLNRIRLGRLARGWAFFLVPFVALVTPWFLLISRRQPGFLSYFFWRHNVVRFASGFDHQASWWFYLPVIVAIMLPASLLFPALLRFLTSRSEDLRRLRTKQLGFLMLAGAWPIIFFSFSGAKLPSYVLPALPPTSLLLGALLANVGAGSAHPLFERLRMRTPRRIAFLGLSAIVLLALLDIRFDGADASTHSLVWALAGGALVAAAGLALLGPRMGRHWWPAAALVWWAALGFLFLDFYPEIANLRGLPTRALEMADQLGTPRPAVVSLGSPYGPGRAYMGRDGVEDIAVDDSERLLAYAGIYPRLLLIMDPGYRSEVKALLSDWRLERAEQGEHLFLASSPALTVDRRRTAERRHRDRVDGQRRGRRRGRLEGGSSPLTPGPGPAR